MRVMLGVGQPDCSKTVTGLLARLRFPSVQVDVVHVIETLQIPGWRELPEGAQDAVSTYHRRREEEAQRAVEQAASELKSLGLTSRTVVLRGFAADQLMAHADNIGADLIAVAGSQRNPLDAFFTGSVTRALVIEARQSLLIAKHEPANADLLTAVFATDHSDYVDRCAQRLAVLSPCGLKRLIILTGYEADLKAFAAVRPYDSQLVGEVAQWLEKRLHEKSGVLCSKLEPLGARCESRVMQGQPVEAINATMKETGADLLILGAQGHGFVQRLKIGSTSLHEAVGEAHSVLVLRV